MSLVWTILLVLALLSSSEETPLNQLYSGVELGTKRELYRLLFSQYEINLSPYQYDQDSIYMGNESSGTVDLGLQYLRIVSVQEKYNTYSSIFGFVMAWRDRRLQWNPEAHGNVSYIHVTSANVWVPEIAICESSYAEPVNPARPVNVKLNSTGHMVALFIYSTTSSCDFRAPSEWHARMLRNPFPEDNAIFPLRVFGVLFALSRYPEFWEDCLIIPTFLLAFISLIGVFLGPAETIIENSVTLCLTTMMSMTVIIQILSESIAKADHVPALARFTINLVILIVIAVFLRIILHISRNFLHRIRHEQTEKLSAMSLRWLPYPLYRFMWQIIRRINLELIFCIVFQILNLINLIGLFKTYGEPDVLETLKPLIVATEKEIPLREFS